MKIIIGCFGMVALLLMCGGVVIIIADFVQGLAEIISGDNGKQKGK